MEVYDTLATKKNFQNNDLDEETKLYLEAASEIIAESNITAREFSNFNDIYEYSGIRKTHIIRLLKSDIEFHAKIAATFKDANRAVHKLKGYKYKFLKEKYTLDMLPDDISRNEKFMKMISAWNEGVRNRSELSRIAETSRDSVYRWLNKLNSLA